jgi:hypothetical protein
MAKATRYSIALINESKYAQAPSWGQIEELINEMGMEMYHFERFYGIPFNTLTQVKAGKRNLGSCYWHYIYEKIKPAYGAGFLDDSTKKQSKNRINTSLTANLTVYSDGDAHSRLGRVK